VVRWIPNVSDLFWMRGVTTRLSSWRRGSAAPQLLFPRTADAGRVVGGIGGI